jgi:tRNA(fMet)-specific endonuclease VapC
MRMLRPQYLLDSDILIDHALGFGPTIRLVTELAPSGLCISIISYGEVLEGTLGRSALEPRTSVLSEMLRSIAIINLDTETMNAFAELRFNLRRAGRIIGDLDILIAATAIRHDLTLITRNIRHFERITVLRLLSPFPSE